MWGKRLSGRSWVLVASLLCLLFGAAGTAPQADAYQSGHHGYWRWRWHWHRPAVASVSPSSGPAAGGTSVTISGANFTHATAVRFGSTAATSFVVDSATEITAVSPAGAGTVKVTVTTPAGTSCSPTYYSYLPSPAVTGVSPSAGLAAGGTSVTITGSYFTNATAVGFGTTPATSFTVDSDSQITASAPAGTGIVDVTVASLGGTSTTSSSDEYTYEEPPTAQVLSPETGETYNLNQAVPTAFSCTDDPNGPGIQTCTDSNDATDGMGELDTTAAGPHTYTVTATSQDGQTQTAHPSLHRRRAPPPKHLARERRDLQPQPGIATSPAPTIPTDPASKPAPTQRRHGGRRPHLDRLIVRRERAASPQRLPRP